MISRALILARVVRLGMSAPGSVTAGWNRFWLGVTATGEAGDVLWDSENPTERGEYLPYISRYLDPALPVVDVGCGNGRYTRWLAVRFPAAVGVDVAPAAVTRARNESAGTTNVSFRVMDATAEGAGAQLRAELGEANVFVRGLFHTLDPATSRALAGELRPVLGSRGRLLLTETDYPGGQWEYLELLGATARTMPTPLARAITVGSRPHPFGPPELHRAFPDRCWDTITDGSTTIRTIPLQHAGEGERIPGYLAVLAAKDPL